MICSNCGMSIPVQGKICHYCQADKTADQQDALKNNRSEGLVAGAFIIGAILGLTVSFALFSNLLTAAIGGAISSSTLGLLAHGITNRN